MFAPVFDRPPDPLSAPCKMILPAAAFSVRVAFSTIGIAAYCVSVPLFTIDPPNVMPFPDSRNGPAEASNVSPEKSVPVARSFALVVRCVPAKSSASPETGALPPQLSAVLHAPSAPPPVQVALYAPPVHNTPHTAIHTHSLIRARSIFMIYSLSASCNFCHVFYRAILHQSPAGFHTDFSHEHAHEHASL